MFQKRHYESIALAMQTAAPNSSPKAKDSPAEAQWIHSVNCLAQAFGKDNTRFNNTRFVAACYPGADVRAS